MDDQHTTSSEDEREQRAFHDAFAGVSAGTQPRPLDAELLRRKARTRSRAKIGGAAVAVLLVAGGAVGGVELLADSGNSHAANLPQPPDGWRWEFYRDIRVQVPSAWAYDEEPSSDWCVDHGRWLPKEPYIDLSGGEVAVLGIGCPDSSGSLSNEPPPDMWVDHVTVRPVKTTDQASDEQVDGWWIVRQPVGDVLVRAVTRDHELAQGIVSTAEAVTDDSSGCAPHSPLQDSAFPRPDPAFDVDALTDVDTITVCQYTDLTKPANPGLSGVREIGGSDADVELAALKAAPIGGGPDHPNDCMQNDPGDSAIELKLHTGADVVSMYVFYSTCHGNGFDDGTNLRELTTDACQPLVELPVAIWSGSSASFERCVGD